MLTSHEYIQLIVILGFSLIPPAQLQEMQFKILSFSFFLMKSLHFARLMSAWIMRTKKV